MKKGTSIKTKLRLIAVFIVAVILLSACSWGVLKKSAPPDISANESSVVTTSPDVETQDTSSAQQSEDPKPQGTTDSPEQSKSPESHEPHYETTTLDETLQVFVFDVGQADCILVKTGQYTMLLDAGDTGQGSLILGYLSDNGVSELNYLVATHPHADHIGSMAHIIRAMGSIGFLLMPDVIHTTKTGFT